MGDFQKRISRRIAHLGMKYGFCLICGEKQKLSQDHVPPQCCVTLRPVEQRLVTEMMGLEAVNFKGVKARNGSSFRTICVACNRRLGLDDGIVGAAYKKITRQVLEYFRPIGGNLLPLARVEIDPVRYARSLIGHMLAATTEEECIKSPIESEYFTPLKKFVMGDDSAINDTHDIYYWFYPRDMHISAKFVTVRNQGHTTSVSVLSFFPVGFMVTLKDKGTFPVQATKLDFNEKYLTLNISPTNLEFASFPFVPLEGDQMFALKDAQAIVSYPARD